MTRDSRHDERDVIRREDFGKHAPKPEPKPDPPPPPPDK